MGRPPHSRAGGVHNPRSHGTQDTLYDLDEETHVIKMLMNVKKYGAGRGQCQAEKQMGPGWGGGRGGVSTGFRLLLPKMGQGEGEEELDGRNPLLSP